MKRLSFKFIISLFEKIKVKNVSPFLYFIKNYLFISK